MEKKELDPKGRVVETKSGRFFKVGEQLNTGEAAAVTAFNSESVIKEDKESTKEDTAEK